MAMQQTTGKLIAVLRSTQAIIVVKLADSIFEWFVALSSIDFRVAMP